MRLTGRRRKREIDRVTLGLAGSALLTGGAVLVGEFRRRLRGRLAERDVADVTGPDAAVEALQAAGQASQDTLLVAIEGYSGASRRETVLFNLFGGFVGAFGWARLSTAGIRAGWWPLSNVRLGDSHIHHFVPGIGLAFGAGAAGLITDSQDIEAALAIPFGIGAGLTFDEAALLLRLQDVYWTREGLLSVQVSLATASLLGAAILGARMLRQGEQRRAEQGLIPQV